MSSQQNKTPLNLKSVKRIVIKIGSNILADENGVREDFFTELVEQVYFLREKKIQVVIVSSGAIASAMSFLQQTKRPRFIPDQQAFAAIGQPLLMNHYARALQKRGMNLGQVLLTQDGLDNRKRFLHAKHALNSLLAHGVIPIVNENDTVAVEEIKIGDNDRLSAHVANLVEADLLVILSHVSGLYTGNPEADPTSTLIPVVNKIDHKIKACVYTERDERTTGGMHTKLIAAKYCMDYGIPVLITSGFQKNIMQNIFAQTIKGTWFVPATRTVSARKHWIGNISRPHGAVVIDKGAEKALLADKKSLLPSGIVSVSGTFGMGDCVEIIDKKGVVLGRGLSCYTKGEIEKIKGLKTSEIEGILGYKNSDEVIHRDDMVIHE